MRLQSAVIVCLVMLGFVLFVGVMMAFTQRGVRQTIQLKMIKGGEPAAAVEVELSIPGSSKTEVCGGEPIGGGPNAEFTRTDGTYKWSRPIRRSSRGSNGQRRHYPLGVCAKAGGEWLPLWRSADTAGWRQVDIECDLSTAPNSTCRAQFSDSIARPRFGQFLALFLALAVFVTYGHLKLSR